MSSIVVVVNPASGGGRTGAQWPVALRCLRDAGVDVDARFTSSKQEATDLCREALREGAERVVAAGGDGTLNEVLNGFFEPDGRPVAPDAALGVLPGGTGGDFRRSAGVPLELGAACALLARGEVREVDVGRIEFTGPAAPPPRHFINVADCGIGGDVVERVNNGRRVVNGSLTFTWHSLAAVLAYRSRRVRVEVEAPGAGAVRREGVMQNVVVANGGWFGGGMHVAPGARLDDGLFDVVLFSSIPRARTLIHMRRIYAGTHIGADGVEAHRGARVTVTPLEDGPVLFDVDGEQIGRAPATLLCLPRALRLVAP